MRPRDLLKLGSLYLNGGRWNGRQILPEAWVEESLRPHVEKGPPSEHGDGVTSHGSYGYQWHYDHYQLPYGEVTVHFADGNGGQLIWVVPELNLVAVQVAGNYGLWQYDYQAERLLLERIVPWALGVEATYQHEIARPVHPVKLGEWSSTTLTAHERALYVGWYDFAGERLGIYDENGVLRFELPGAGAVDLLPEGNHVFAAGLVEGDEPTKLYWPDARLHFVLDSGGEVERFEWREVVTGIVTSVGTRMR